MLALTQHIPSTVLMEQQANDWGAMDGKSRLICSCNLPINAVVDNLASQRAQHLAGLLPVALAFGLLEPTTTGEGEPLRVRSPIRT